jgi:probable rRNA maturation factor
VTGARALSGTIEIVNRQRRRHVDRARWEAFAEQAVKAIGAKARGQGATIVFVSDRTMRRLNRRFRGRDRATDVLSFPAGQEEFELAAEVSLGDVVVSVERAESQAAAHGLDFEGEVAQLVLHGLLHLCGYDHERDDGTMNRLELRLRRRLGI